VHIWVGECGYDIASKGVKSVQSGSATLQVCNVQQSSSLQCLILDVVIDVTTEHVRRAAAKWRERHMISRLHIGTVIGVDV
jgi:hypothetical protein